MMRPRHKFDLAQPGVFAPNTYYFGDGYRFGPGVYRVRYQGGVLRFAGPESPYQLGNSFFIVDETGQRIQYNDSDPGGMQAGPAQAAIALLPPKDITLSHASRLGIEFYDLYYPDNVMGPWGPPQFSLERVGDAPADLLTAYRALAVADGSASLWEMQGYDPDHLTTPDSIGGNDLSMDGAPTVRTGPGGLLSLAASTPPVYQSVSGLPALPSIDNPGVGHRRFTAAGWVNFDQIGTPADIEIYFLAGVYAIVNPDPVSPYIALNAGDTQYLDLPQLTGWNFFAVAYDERTATRFSVWLNGALIGPPDPAAIFEGALSDTIYLPAGFATAPGSAAIALWEINPNNLTTSNPAGLLARYQLLTQ